MAKLPRHTLIRSFLSAFAKDRLTDAGSAGFSLEDVKSELHRASEQVFDVVFDIFPADDELITSFFDQHEHFVRDTRGSAPAWWIAGRGPPPVTGGQIRMGRAALAWSVRELAERSGLHRSTITRLERGAEGEPQSREAVERALTAAGVTFLEDDGSGPGVRLKEGVTPEND